MKGQWKEKIKYVVIGVVVAFGLYFAYSFYAQVQRNSKNINVVNEQLQINTTNIDAIAKFLSQPQQTQTAPAKAPVKKESTDDGN